MSKFRKKPVIIEAVRFVGSNFEECCDFIGESNLADGTSEDEKYIGIATLEGIMDCRESDWIIKGVMGEFYPCRSDIFEKTYEPVD
jgi:hypothetical protein